jgi:hypothetical protein
MIVGAIDQETTHAGGAQLGQVDLLGPRHAPCFRRSADLERVGDRAAAELDHRNAAASRDQPPACSPLSLIGSRNRFIVNSMFCDCRGRQLSTWVLIPIFREALEIFCGQLLGGRALPSEFLANEWVSGHRIDAADEGGHEPLKRTVRQPDLGRLIALVRNARTTL